MENKRNGKIFHSKLNKCISPKVGALPAYSKKEEVVDDLHEFIIENRGRLPILYRYSPADYFNVSALLNGELYLVSANHMNDYWEGNRDWGSNYSAEESAKNVKDEQKHIYLKSFSEDENSDYMWKKYADNFNGMCVAYDFSNASDELLRKLYPVQYTFTGFCCENNMKPLINPYYYLRKSKEWEPEHEWRFIEKEDRVLTEPKCEQVGEYIRAVYFGIGMDNSLKNHIECKLREENRFEKRKYFIDFYDMKTQREKRVENDNGDPNF